MAKLRLADQFNPFRQIPCTFFQAPHVSDCRQQCDSIGCYLSLVDLYTAAALSCKQRHRSLNKMVWFFCYYCSTTHFNNLFLHRLRKSHCIRPSSGQAVANAALGSKCLAIPGLSWTIKNVKPAVSWVISLRFFRTGASEERSYQWDNVVFRETELGYSMQWTVHVPSRICTRTRTASRNNSYYNSRGTVYYKFYSAILFD